MNTNKIKIILVSIFIIFTLVMGTNIIEPINVSADTYVGENFCGEDSVQRIMKIAGYVLIIAKVAVPLIIIVIGMFDLFQAVIGKDNKVLTQKVKTLALRIVLGVFIFFIPSIVNWGFDLFYDESDTDSNNQCIECLLDPTDC